MPIDLGQITFGIGADTTRLRSAINDITGFSGAVVAAAQSTAAGANLVATALAKQEAATISAIQKVQRFQDAANRLKAPDALINGFNQLSTVALDRLTQRMVSGQLTALQYQREMERFNVTMNNGARIMKNFTEAQRTAEANSLVTSLQKLSGAAVLVAGPLSGIATRISVLSSLAEHFTLSTAAMVAGIAAGAYAFYELGKAAINVERTYQKISATMMAVTGNQDIANTQMKYLMDLSNRSGVSFAELAKQYGQITAAAKGTNLEGERTNNIFEGIVFASSKLGLSSQETTGALLAIQQMMSKGVISAEELKGQLGDRLPGAVQVMAASMGITTQALAKMMKAGEVSSLQLIGFVEKLKERYNVDTAAKIETITAAEGRLTNARFTAIDALDKVVGFSSAYYNMLERLSSFLNTLAADMGNVVKWTVAIGAGLASAFIVPGVVAGIAAISAGVVSLTTALISLNVAAISGNAARTLIMTIARLGLAVAGGVAAYQYTSKALEDVQKSYLQATPAVEAYLAAQEKAFNSVRGPTRDYIKQQEELLKVQEQMRGKYLDQLQGEGGKDNFAELNDSFLKTNDAISKTKQNLTSLYTLLKKQDDFENKARKDPAKEVSDRATNAMERAQESIRNVREEYNALYLAPAAKEWAQTQNDITHKTEQFEEALTRAKVPAGEIVKLTKEYGDTLRKLKEGEIILKNHTSAFQVLAGTIGRGMDQGLSEFVDVLVDGKDKAIAFADTVKFMAKDILKTLLQLAALNPLKNALFGTNAQTLGGGGGIGGLIGSFFGGGNSSSSGGSGIGPMPDGSVMPSSFAMGGIMTASGSKPLRRYSSGGIANSSQFAEFGEGSRPEAYVPLPDGRSIPVTLAGGGGGGGLEVHVHEAPGTKATVQRTKTDSGQQGLRVVVQQLMRDTWHQDIADAGPMSRGLERQFGLNRAKGIG